MKLQQLPTVLHHFFAAQWRWCMLSGHRLVAYQDRRARRMIAHAQRHSPFYREQWGTQYNTDWRKLPTIDKATMMANFARFNRYGITAEQALCAAHAAEESIARSAPLRAPSGEIITAGLSSGTSGERGLFLVTEHEIAMWAGVILARTLHTIPWRGCRVAFFLRAFSTLYAGVNSPLLQLRYFALTEPHAEVVTALNAFRPHIVVGPPSLLAALAQARRQGKLHIAPARLIAVAEVLEPQDEASLRSEFAVPVHQIYQCTEGLLAVSCVHGSLHVQEDLVAMQLELVSSPRGANCHVAETTRCAPVEPARYTPIITDLWRTTQPILRYRLGDLLQIADEPCPCGSTFRVIRAIEGRLTDLLYFTVPGCATRIPFFPATLRTIVLNSSPAITDYQLTQAADDQLAVHLAVDAAVDFATVAQQLAANLTAHIVAHGCQQPVLSVVPGIPARPATAKRRRVQRGQS